MISDKGHLGSIASPVPELDLRASILQMAEAPITIKDESGKRKTVTTFEARLLELGSTRCKRRLYCQDFIWLVMTAMRMTRAEFATEMSQIMAVADNRKR